MKRDDSLRGEFGRPVHFFDPFLAANTATISAGTGNMSAYCNDQSNMAIANAILPGLGDSIYNYDNVDVPQKLTAGVLESLFGFGTAAGQAMSATSKSDAALTSIRAATGIPKTFAQKAFFWIGAATTAYQIAKAGSIGKNVYQTCMAHWHQ